MATVPKTPALDQAAASARIRLLWVQMQLAVARFIALLVFIGMHWILGHLIDAVVPQDWARGKQLLEGIFLVAFGLVYVAQSAEMMAIFVPRMRVLQNKVLGEHNPG